MEENSSLSTSSALSWGIEMCNIIQLTIAREKEGRRNNWAVWMSTTNYEWSLMMVISENIFVDGQKYFFLKNFSMFNLKKIFFL